MSNRLERYQQFPKRLSSARYKTIIFSDEEIFTNINVALKIMDYIEQNIKPNCPTNPTKRKIKKDSIGA